MRRSFLTIGLFTLLAPAALLRAECWLGTGDFTGCPASVGLPAHTSQNFESQAACLAAVNENRLACGVYRCQACEGASSSGSGGGDSLQQATGKALAEGMVRGDAQTFGVGLLGLGAMAILNGNSGPSPEELQARQERERQRQAAILAAQKAEEERRRKFEADKQEAFADLKEAPQPAAGDDEIKDLNEADLKDAPNDTPGKVKKIHLKPMADPLHRPALPGDSRKAKLVDDWAAARALAKVTIAEDKTTGKIAVCPDGFPYYCGGACYREAALDNMRVPCDSALTTVKFSNDELK